MAFQLIAWLRQQEQVGELGEKLTTIRRREKAVMVR